VLTPGDIKDGYPKTDVLEFISFLQKSCALHQPLLENAELEKLAKAAGISDTQTKNGKA